MPGICRVCSATIRRRDNYCHDNCVSRNDLPKSKIILQSTIGPFACFKTYTVHGWAAFQNGRNNFDNDHNPIMLPSGSHRYNGHHSLEPGLSVHGEKEEEHRWLSPWRRDKGSHCTIQGRKLFNRLAPMLQPATILKRSILPVAWDQFSRTFKEMPWVKKSQL